MAVRPVFLAVESPKGLAKHLLHATERQEERDAQAPYQDDPAPGQHRGSVPIVQPDMPVRVREGLRLHPHRTPTQLELENLLTGLRADGSPLARSPRANGSEDRRMHALLVTTAPHISVSIARALTGTEAGRAMIDSAERGANADLMAHMERKFLGHTRRGAAGRLGEEQGRVGRIEIPHKTTRETMDRRSAPMSHIENIIPNAVFTDSGFVGAMNLRRMHGHVGDLNAVLNESLFRRLRAMGADVRMQGDVCVMSEVPEPLCRAMARRTNQATEWAQAYATKNGLGRIDDLTPQLRYDLIKRGAKMTQRTSHDAVGDRAAWRADAAQFDFWPRDLVDGAKAWRPAALVGSVVEKAAAVRRAGMELWQGARQMAESALAAGRAPPSIARVADVARMRHAIVQATADMQAAARTLAPPPSQQARETLAHWRGAVRQKTAELGTAVAREAARRTGAELNAWATAYRLRPLLRAASAAVRWGATQARGVDVRQAAVDVRRMAGAVRAAADDAAKAAPAGAGAISETFAALRAARLVGGVREMPIAARAAAVKAVGPPSELPIARRAREAAAMAVAKPVAPVARSAKYNPESAATMVRGIQRSPGEQSASPEPPKAKDEVVAGTTPAAPAVPARRPNSLSPEQDAARRSAWVAELQEVKEGLRNNAADVAVTLLGKPTMRTGTELRWGKNGSLAVSIAGPDRGKWFDHQAGTGGDVLKLIMERGGLPFGRAVAFAREKLGMPQPGAAKPLSHGERLALERRHAEMAERRTQEAAAHEATRHARHETVARRAAFVLERSKPADGSHPYLNAKGLPPAGERVDRRGRLRLPLQDHTGKVWSLQHIEQHADGSNSKRFLRASKAGGMFTVIGKVEPGKPVAFVEGHATGRSFHRATGLPVAVTYSVGNKQRVMTEWRQRDSKAVLVDAYDNDHHKPRRSPPQANAGLEMAERLRGEIGAVPVGPPFRSHDAGKDWNDYERQHGSAAMRETVRQQAPAAFSAAEPLRAAEAAYVERMKTPAALRVATARMVPAAQEAPQQSA